MLWPETPSFHGSTPMGFEQPVWRPEDLKPVRTCDCGYESVGPYGYPFRTCGFCGSMHPGDLVRVLQAGARLGGSDWKYRYPHKFYVEGVPNPLAGQPVDISSSSKGFDHSPTAEEVDHEKARLSTKTHVVANLREPGWCPGKPANNTWLLCLHTRSEAPPTTFAKFYTDHLEDQGYDAEAHDLLLKLVSEHSGIAFSRKDDSTPEQPSILYAAPYFGYQRA